jgi:hypothetical protein
MAPLVEITNEADLDELGPYETAGDFLMVELPQYLTDRPNKYNETVTAILNRYGSVEDFYRDNSEKVDVPVVSGSIEPVDYAEYAPIYRSIENEFEQVAVRLMIRGFTDPLTGDQRDTLEDLAETLQPEDVVLFDLVDNGVTDPLMDDLEYLADLFDENLIAVLNAFDAYNEHPENQSPHIADDIGVSAFGDFGINQRFKPDGGGPIPEVNIRHYHPNESTVEFFVGDDYEDAADELTQWDEWDRSHCDGCRRADRTTNNDANTWSQIKMQHYFSSILAGQI